MGEVESSLVSQDRYVRLARQIHRSTCLQVSCWVVLFLCFAGGLAIDMGNGWKPSGFALYIFILLVVGGLICAAVIGWQVHLGLLERKEKKQDIVLADQDIALRRRVLRAADRAEANGDNFKLVLNEKGGVTIEVVRASTQLEQARIQYAPKIKEVIGRQPVPAIAPPAAPVDEDDDEQEPIPVPEAPDFWSIIDLITIERMPLCFIVDMNPSSPTFGETIPAFGTILDLLSLCVIGRPGRGKSVLLLYYICCLAQHGAEMHVLDPQGAFKELMLLHGRVLPAMPPTARIYYYSGLADMEAAVENVLADISERERLFQPHLEEGEAVLHRLKHPLVVLADELPIIAEMDAQIREQRKEENRARKAEGLELLKIRQVTQMVKTSVLAARKFNVYFIGASQSLDATILPTKITDAFNSRIIFSSTQRKARLVGLEPEDAKRLLPIIKRAGAGKTIYDCGRWDEPRVAAIPMVTIEDVLAFFGITMEELRRMWREELLAKERQGQQRITGPLGPTTPRIVPAKPVVRRATLTDAIQVWNEVVQDSHEIGRPRLQHELQARGLECSDDLAKNLLRMIKQQLEKNAGGVQTDEDA